MPKKSTDGAVINTVVEPSVFISIFPLSSQTRQLRLFGQAEEGTRGGQGCTVFSHQTDTGALLTGRFVHCGSGRHSGKPAQ